MDWQDEMGGWDGMEWTVGGGMGDVSNESRCSFEPRCLAGWADMQDTLWTQ